MRIAIAGLGTIGRTLARRLADGVPGLTLACAAARDEEKARGWLDEEGIEVPIVHWGNPSRRWIRISAQAYNVTEHYRALAEDLRSAA